jgi:hypothetical protein
MGIGALREWESDGQYIASLALRKARPRAAGAPLHARCRATTPRGIPTPDQSMPVRSRFAFPLALALSGASLAIAPAAGAQRATLASDSASLVQPAAAQPAATQAVPVGPTMEAASVAVRHAPVADAAKAPRGGYGQPVALMVVGGAAVLVGLIIGGGAGTAIAIGGAVAGLVGLYQYLQ